MNEEKFGWRGTLERCGLVSCFFAFQMKFGKKSDWPKVQKLEMKLERKYKDEKKKKTVMG